MTCRTQPFDIFNLERRDEAVRPCYRPQCQDNTRAFHVEGWVMGLVDVLLKGFVVSIVV